MPYLTRVRLLAASASGLPLIALCWQPSLAVAAGRSRQAGRQADRQADRKADTKTGTKEVGKLVVGRDEGRMGRTGGFLGLRRRWGASFQD